MLTFWGVSCAYMEKRDIKSMTLEEIAYDMADLSLESYRAAQIYRWIVKGSENFCEMKNIPKKLIALLSEKYYIASTKIKVKKVSKDSTVKYLFELQDGLLIEAVVMKYVHGYSMCISTQAGCKMGCAFCVTGKNGFNRNLTPSEMISQIQVAEKDLNIRISNIVLMGMGEPLDNYENVLKFLKLISSEDHLNIGMRHISLSTCGIVDKIYDLSKRNLPLTLSVSLHAPNDKIRNQIMKINKKWNIHELIDACKFYLNHGGRRISFEYTMIENFNDTTECANELAKLLKGMLCHVNLISLNEAPESSFKSSSKARIYLFQSILQKRGINATIRRTLGKDIDAACGQLKGKYRN